MMTMLGNGVCLCATIEAFPNLSKYKSEENAVYEGTIGDEVLLGNIWNLVHKVRGANWTEHEVVITGCGITPMIKEKYLVV